VGNNSEFFREEFGIAGIAGIVEVARAIIS
jgi:hypothetical protein